MKTNEKIIISCIWGIIAVSLPLAMFIIFLILLIINSEPVFWSSSDFVFPVSFILLFIVLFGLLLNRAIREKTIIDDEGISARFYIETKRILPILRYKSNYETIPFSEIAGMKNGSIHSTAEYYDQPTLVIQTKDGRELHFQSSLYSKKTMTRIADELNQKTNTGTKWRAL